MSIKIKTVLLKNFNINKDVRPFTPYKEDVEIKWSQETKDDRKNSETYASIIGTKKEINNQLDILSKNIISERCRTLNSLPKWRIINTTKKRIY